MVFVMRWTVHDVVDKTYALDASNLFHYFIHYCRGRKKVHAIRVYSTEDGVDTTVMLTLTAAKGSAGIHENSKTQFANCVQESDFGLG